jgi:hypothetical protein
VEYNDHFETPLEAYQDIQPLIDWVHRANNHDDRPSSPPVLYDPYYCDGRSKALLESLGYAVIHEKRDFYDDVDSGRVPGHDALVTNPPYSDDHKARIFDYCCSRLSPPRGDSASRGSSPPTPFFVLVPAYVASRAYFRSCLDRHGAQGGVVYLVPGSPDHRDDHDDYRYDHPEATGKEASPFRSLWVCGIGRDKALRAREWWNEHRKARRGSETRQRSVSLYCSLVELERAGVVSSQKRPNPRQRKKRKGAAAGVEGAPPSQPLPPAPVSSVPPKNRSAEKARPEKKSKYRDESGKRSRGRF